MTKEELLKIDEIQLLVEKELLEKLLISGTSGPREFWRVELERINKSLMGLVLQPNDRTNVLVTPPHF